MAMEQNLSPLTEASFYVLLAFHQPRHGYGVIKWVEEHTTGRLVLAAGTLYGVINSFLKNDLIELDKEEGNRSKKTYRITQKGQALLEFEVQRLQQMVGLAKEELS